MRVAGSRVFALVVVVVVVVAVGVAGFVVIVDGGTSKGDYRVDAIFDVARGIGTRQVVKIGGAAVGTVVGVHLTGDNKARVEMSIDPRFAPFRADASCRIGPEGLISENFVAGGPGS